MKTTELRDGKFSSDGSIDVYINLIEFDGETIKAARLHSIKIEPDSDYAERLAAVNLSIVEGLGFPAITSNEWAKVVNECTKVHTPEVKASFAVYKASQITAALEAK